MKKLFFTLAMLINVCCIAQIKAYEKAETMIVSTEFFKDIRQQIDKPFTSLEQMPQYPKGDAAMMKYIKENLQYPESAVKNGIQGRVVVRFVVSKDGSLKDIQVLRSLDAVCDKEAVRIIKSMPKWIPGKQNGKAVDVYYTLPVVFKLGEENK